MLKGNSRSGLVVSGIMTARQSPDWSLPFELHEVSAKPEIQNEIANK
ncbi:MAG: hypothetical protein HN936_16420 [Bacteroidetes bacterium]|nr:hypothetical protein [Bacteroidota bacterium]